MKHKSKEQILNVLSLNLRNILLHANINYYSLQELRIRIGKPFIIQENGKERLLQHIVTREDLQETLEHISNYSLYAYETEMQQGFITIEGGHRVGLSGKVIIENGKVKNFQYIFSINIRICHEIIGCADNIIPLLVEKNCVLHTLLISPPGQGKTTLLRDIIRQLSNGNFYIKGQTVCVIDERSEIGGSCQGIPQNDIGKRTDILDNCPKDIGMLMMIRSMAPRILAVDEIGTRKDVDAIDHAIRSGVTIIATAHANSLEEVKTKKGLKELYDKQCFKRYLIIGRNGQIGKIHKIYNEWGNELCL